MKIHEKYINRCIQLAQNGLGTTYPNPMVGSVLVYKENIIGEGWHRAAGEPHAEVMAIRSVKNRDLLKKATIYVSLEPCSHYGKTPPCSDLIIASGIKKVIIGTIDPFAKVAGKGIKKLMDAGCEVTLGVLDKECQALNKRFFTFHKKQRPYIILKWAQTRDGFIAPETRDSRKPVWITGALSNQLVHKWRSEEQGILIGTNTAVEDDPKLNTRLWDGPDPTRIIIDKNLRTPIDSCVYDQSVKTIFICAKHQAKDVQIDQGKHQLIFAEIDFEAEIASQICEILCRHEIQSVIIEGGTRTLQTFIQAGLWDEARIFTGNIDFKSGVKAPEFQGNFKEQYRTGVDTLMIYSND
ncbi:bifunctional diaminohydroxyphosphoribosylaminopyrimidine deaminase/5-amino-6-(5-phosphoribosylamino)uracil reductase RibD [Antarcticibacterium arcticum]|uniref:Riboflavin biosynthesis protein RibD n=1 Tax=Antarcticibacterium arcticum TaxID=2585771 RepID=A0A5B8YHR3_9FLAO|nr:bifunctional diaminohydroxyphosphoribosylaminopyrimidine deaminase/5-amino-6-(5-phosphoribosylamino)uracil reductase RibD [Antarcticibacterium arcticum]QED36377.1 bifunctional diaminohydroxyphosphoribosylaminopyrimidine deaminase/5-amino-6-(5-phosphoribosylamino)uracil reductase RibD [Antarcticibacterium arcticum]